MAGERKGKLEDLMLVYADLSAPAKRPGFKGPPIKEVVRESKSASFQPSTKARDWKTLDQSLESAFTIESSSGPRLPVAVPPLAPFASPVIIHTVQPSPHSTSSNVNLLQTELAGPSLFLQPQQSIITPSIFQQPAAPTVKQPPTCQQVPSDEEWGDFQSFPAGKSSNISATALTQMSQSLYSPQPTSEPQLFSGSQPFSSDLLLGTPVADGSILSSVNSFSGSSVGSRLATFQAESPVHRFKSLQVSSSQLELPDEEDFGDFADFQSVAASSSLPPTLRQPPATCLPVPHSQGSGILPSLPTTASTADKYSAFRDLLEPDLVSNGLDSINTSSDNLVLASPGLKVSSPGLQASLLSPAGSSIKNNASFSSEYHNTSSEGLITGLNISGNGLQANRSASDSLGPATDSWSSLSAAAGIPQFSIGVPKDDFADFGDFVEPPPPPASSSLVSSKTSFFSWSPVMPPSMNVVSKNELHTEVDEWSLPAAGLTAQQSARPSTGGNMVPFLASSSPPLPSDFIARPPLMSSSPPLAVKNGSRIYATEPDPEEEDFQLPSEQLQLSDQELFGVVEQPRRYEDDAKPASIADVIHSHRSGAVKSQMRKAAAPTPPFTTEEEEEEGGDWLRSLQTSGTTAGSAAVLSLSPKQGSPATSMGSPVPASASKSPESVSIASLDLEPTAEERSSEQENAGNVVEPSHQEESAPEVIPEPVRDWILCLKEVLAILQSTLQVLSRAPSDSVREEVLASLQGQEYVEDLMEVYTVYRRIKTSYQHNFACSEIGEWGQVEAAVAERTEVASHILSTQLTLDKIDSDILRTVRPTEQVENLMLCGVCLLSLYKESLKRERVCPTVFYCGREYHASCANFWINLVDSCLPSFIITHQLAA